MLHNLQFNLLGFMRFRAFRLMYEECKFFKVNCRISENGNIVNFFVHDKLFFVFIGVQPHVREAWIHFDCILPHVLIFTHTHNWININMLMVHIMTMKNVFEYILCHEVNLEGEGVKLMVIARVYDVRFPPLSTKTYTFKYYFSVYYRENGIPFV